jgi:hypothetical protein
MGDIEADGLSEALDDEDGDTDALVLALGEIDEAPGPG